MMQHFKSLSLSILMAILIISQIEAFSSSSSFLGRSSCMPVIKKNVPNGRSTNLQMFFGAAKDDGTPGDYVCKDCGYIFTKGPAAWAKVDGDSYQCPPCGSPKFRFKKIPKAGAPGKAVKGKAVKGKAAAPAPVAKKKNMFGF
mmetsp:Transcript_62172/g.74810  ORF Transcript_62172/g.74810 Transcript_62172/m.74810 type:complete len:143 (+) Transcript_62172:112-540(+)